MRQVSVVTAVAPEKADFVNDTYLSLTAQVMPDEWAWRWVVQQDGPGNVGGLLPAGPRISFAVGRRSGQAVTRNLALARAEGELVRVLDADDQLPPGALARDIDVLTHERRMAGRPRGSSTCSRTGPRSDSPSTHPRDRSRGEQCCGTGWRTTIAHRSIRRRCACAETCSSCWAAGWRCRRPRTPASCSL